MRRALGEVGKVGWRWVRGVLAELVGGVGEMLVAKVGVLAQVLGQAVDLLGGGALLGDGLGLGVQGGVDAAVLQLVLGVDQRLGGGGGRVEGVVVVLVRRGGRGVVGHLGEHPVLHARL